MKPKLLIYSWPDVVEAEIENGVLKLTDRVVDYFSKLEDSGTYFVDMVHKPFSSWKNYRATSEETEGNFYKLVLEKAVEVGAEYVWSTAPLKKEIPVLKLWNNTRLSGIASMFIKKKDNT